MLGVSSVFIVIQNIYYVVLALSFWFSGACSVIFIENKVIEINLGDNMVNDSYFGYSLLLQKGSHPIVIVGSPKQDSKNGGALYSCEISKYHNGNCSKYYMETSNIGDFNGNFLGSALDGDANTGESFIACAPKKVFIVGTFENKNYYLKGFCFLHKNSSRLDADIEFYPLDQDRVVAVGNAQGQYYYDNAFGQAGLDIEYIPGTGRVLMGAPGIKNWNGAMVSQSLSSFGDFKIIPHRLFPSAKANFDYLGYAVTIAKMGNTRYEVAGAPRAENLLGVVKMFNGFQLFQQFNGDETGGYFGSSLLCSDVTNDGIDDLFVGVPMGAGSTFDEGYVYFYKNALLTKVKLFGSRKPGARFGTSISALGDIDLDNYNDIAISAPFEDDGTGAVYIYMGEKQGIKTTYSQRLSPLNFYGNYHSVKGFGLGLSKGNDIDGNGHNDIAVGAYISGQVFVLNSKSVITFAMSLRPNVSSITDKSMSVRYCISYQQRSKTNNLKSVIFQLALQLDYRAVGVRDYKENITVFLENEMCKSLDVFIQPNVVDILPFRITLSSDVLGDIMATGENHIEKEIPYSHGCGVDDICQTKLAMDLIAKTPNIVLGLNREIVVEVTAKNTGEPGYQCNLVMSIPENLKLTRRDCKSENYTFSCPFSRNLAIEDTQAKLVFDVSSVKPTVDEIEVDFDLKCLGENLTPTKQTLSIGVIVQNSPYIEGKPDPENIYYDDESVEDAHEFSHIFTVGNSGPSPVKLRVYLLLPMAQFEGKDVFEFIEAQVDRHGSRVQCYPSNETRIYEKKYDVQSVLTEPLNNTIVVDCFEEGSKCLEILCQGEYLEKSSEVAKYTVKIKTKTSLLAAHFMNELQKKSLVAYVASAFLFNSTSRIEGHSATLIFSSHRKSVPIWVWIIAAVLGVSLLAALIFLLNKCHFFERSYRDKLNGERLMDHQTAEMESTEHDTEDLQNDEMN
ncbi:unnamed protein product [Phaedon cochleariae]|uniref:Integrin alpha second immunoglobulin-like domain-containing protein n=1 Tax=Phaedon cochleariae TaxID=80249 RepID=A0A9P0DKW5_PHACE|nr:unnamed protein product [Phaedon cochleariae]